jgi:hypothetical protein
MALRGIRRGFLCSALVFTYSLAEFQPTLGNERTGDVEGSQSFANEERPFCQIQYRLRAISGLNMVYQ